MAWFRQLGWPITEQAARIIVLNMFFKTPLAFAVVAAISASLMTLLGGVVVLGVYRGLVHFAVLRSASYLNMLSLGVVVVGVFS